MMNKLLAEELVGKAEDYYSFEKKINAVTLDGLKKMASELLKKHSVAMIVPK